jgi:hypothetical protein
MILVTGHVQLTLDQLLKWFLLVEEVQVDVELLGLTLVQVEAEQVNLLKDG